MDQAPPERLAGDGKSDLQGRRDDEFLLRATIRRPAAQVLAFVAVATAVKVALALQQQPDSIEAYHWLYARNPAAGWG